jgi:CBS domain-containing protein
MELTEKLRQERIGHLPLTEIIVLHENTPVAEAVARMEEKRIGCVLIEKEGRLHGLMSERDVLVKYVGGAELDATPIRDLMSTKLETLSLENTMEEAIRTMVKGGYRHVPLVDAEMKILGMIRAIDIVDYIAEHFPAEVFNLPPHPEQKIVSPEGA